MSGELAAALQVRYKVVNARAPVLYIDLSNQCVAGAPTPPRQSLKVLTLQKATLVRRNLAALPPFFFGVRAQRCEAASLWAPGRRVPWGGGAPGERPGPSSNTLDIMVVVETKQILNSFPGP